MKEGRSRKPERQNKVPLPYPQISSDRRRDCLLYKWIGMWVWFGVGAGGEGAGAGPMGWPEDQTLRGGNKGHLGTPDTLLTTYTSTRSQRGGEDCLTACCPPGTQPVQHWF